MLLKLTKDVDRQALLSLIQSDNSIILKDVEEMFFGNYLI